jgi:hypothetical protein
MSNNNNFEIMSDDNDNEAATMDWEAKEEREKGIWPRRWRDIFDPLVKFTTQVDGENDEKGWKEAYDIANGANKRAEELYVLWKREMDVVSRYEFLVATARVEKGGGPPPLTNRSEVSRGEATANWKYLGSNYPFEDDYGTNDDDSVVEIDDEQQVAEIELNFDKWGWLTPYGNNDWNTRMFLRQHFQDMQLEYEEKAKTNWPNHHQWNTNKYYMANQNFPNNNNNNNNLTIGKEQIHKQTEAKYYNNGFEPTKLCMEEPTKFWNSKHNPLENLEFGGEDNVCAPTWHEEFKMFKSMQANYDDETSTKIRQFEGKFKAIEKMENIKYKNYDRLSNWGNDNKDSFHSYLANYKEERYNKMVPYARKMQDKINIQFNQEKELENQNN